MDLRSAHPYWLLKNGLQGSYPALERDARCEVLVVGGGITGALVAYHLAEAGVSTMVLDRRDIGWGSTAASTALLQYEIDTPLHELETRVGRDHAVRSYQACRDAIYKIQTLVSNLDDDCGFKTKPSLYYSGLKRDLPGMKKEFAARRRAGIAVEWWSSRQVAEHMAFKKSCGIYSQDAAQVDAYRLTHTLLRAACQKAVRVHDRTGLAGYEVQGNKVIATTDRGTTILARHIIFATGYEAQGDLDQKVVSLHSSFALVSEPIAGRGPIWHEDCLIWEHADPYLYLRTTEDRRIIIGGEDEDFRDADRRDSLIESKSATLLRKFQHLFPDIPFEVAFAWAGTFGETKDGLPYIGQTPEFPRASFTLGFGGNGIIYSLIAAEIVRDEILGRKNEHADLFRFGR